MKVIGVIPSRYASKRFPSKGIGEAYVATE